MEQIPEFYADNFTVTTSVYGASLSFELASPHPSPGNPMPPRRLVTIRMSLELLKVMAISVARQIKAVERGQGISIQIPSQLIHQLGIAPEDWELFWK